MHNIWKRSLAMFMAFVMVFGMVPVQVFADDCAHANVNVATTAATCDAAGATTTTCGDCGTVLETVEIPATGHSYAPAVTAPTCTVGGYTTYTCTGCGDSYIADEVAATGHSYADGACSVCGEADPAQVNEPAEHTCEFSQEIARTEATCTVDGSVTMKCSCGATNTETLTAPGHSYTEEVERKAATCTEDGYVTMKCSCGETQTETLTAPGHSHTEAITKEATCTENGVKTFTCGVCGDSYTEAIAAPGHTPDESGNSCTVCGEALVAGISEPEDTTIDTEAELQDLLKESGTVTLNSNVIVVNGLHIPEDVEVTLDLAGYTISQTKEKYRFSKYAHVVQELETK